MKNFQPLLLLVVCAILLPSIGSADWQSKRDNKPVSELELMNDNELCSEAHEVCMDITILRRVGTSDLTHLQEIVDGMEYMELVSRVARKRHNGKIPAWMNEMRKAASGSEPILCFHVWVKFFGKKKKVSPQTPVK